MVGLSATLAAGMIRWQARIPADLRVQGTAIFLILVTLLGTAMGPWAVGLVNQALAHPTGLADAMGGVLGVTGLIGCTPRLMGLRRG